MIRTENLNINLPGFSLRDINLELKPGDYLTLLGPSGAGKTILLESLIGLIQPDKGSVLINGSDATQRPPEMRGIAYLPQDLALFPHLSVRQNILFGIADRKNLSPTTETWLNELLQLLNLKQLFNRRSVKNLSGGEQQRVALARALITQPKLILADEPTGALDSKTSYEIMNTLKEVNAEGITLIVVTHEHDIAELTDRVIRLRDGAVEC